ncbi:invasion associated locus B family protein, partial [Actinospica acidiphila]|nr:invasion associated locus B family protein [Actinospica acidiphila]
MTLTGPGPLAPRQAAAVPAAPGCAGMPPLGDGPLSADVVLRARWLDVLLGD